MSVLIIAEIGINHNGDMQLAKKLIDVAALTGADVVKFQKRAIDKVYTPEFLDSPRESPFGSTQRHQKEGLEFGDAEYAEIDGYCADKGIDWFASAWDLESQEFLRRFNLKYNKIASAMLTYVPLLEAVAEEGKETFISTGMSTIEDVDRAVGIFTKRSCPFHLMHCVSTYPMSNEDANLSMIPMLQGRYGCKVGYSGHETGLQISLGAVALGATALERHITLNRAMYGSDQAASIEPMGLMRLVRDTRIIERARGDGAKVVTEGEKAMQEKLRAHFEPGG